MKKSNIGRILVLTLVVVILAFSLTACAGDDDNSIALTKIEGKNLEFEIENLAPQKIRLEFFPYNATNKAVTYETKDSNCATVDDEGNVTPIKLGKTQIIVTSTANPKIFTTINVNVTTNATSLEYSIAETDVVKKGAEDLYYVIIADGINGSKIDINLNTKTYPLGARNDIVYEITTDQTAIVETYSTGKVIEIDKEKGVLTFYSPSLNTKAKTYYVNIIAKNKGAENIQKEITFVVVPYSQSLLELSDSDMQTEFWDASEISIGFVKPHTVEISSTISFEPNITVDVKINNEIVISNLEDKHGTYQISFDASKFFTGKEDSASAEITIKDNITGQTNIEKFQLKYLA